MPDNTALAATALRIRLLLADARQQCADTEELLIASDDLPDLAVEEHVAAQELQQAGRRQQTHQQPILLSGLHWRTPERVEVGGERCRLAFKQRGTDVRTQWRVLDGLQVRVVELFFSPFGPELGSGVGGAVAPLGLADGQQQLGVREQVGDLVWPLVAQMLADALLHHRLGGMAAAARLRALGLDHHERDAVQVGHHVRRPVMRALRRQHLQFLGHVPAVRGSIRPIDHCNRGLVLLAIRHELGDRDAQGQLAVQALVGRHEPFG